MRTITMAEGLLEREIDASLLTADEIKTLERSKKHFY